MPTAADERHLTPVEAEVLKAVRDHPGCDIWAIMPVRRLSFRELRGMLEKLHRAGFVGRQAGLDGESYLSHWYPEVLK